LGPANAARSGLFLLGILDPADELVARQRRDVPPSIKSGGVGDQHRTQVCGERMHDPTWYPRAAHPASLTFSASRHRLRTALEELPDQHRTQ
jgi:hypothetical protein